MENKNIITVIEELGELIDKYKTNLKFKDYEIERLNNKISSIESYINFYSNDEINESEYQEVVEKEKRKII